MDVFSRFFDYLIDSSKKITYKAATTFAFITLLFLIDNTLGFSYYYNISNKVNILEKLNITIKDSSLTMKDKSLLKDVRSNLINHQSLKDCIWNFFTTPNSILSENKSQYLFHYLSSTFFVLAMMIAVFFIGLKAFFNSFSIMSQIFKADPFEILIKLIGVEVGLYLIALLESKVLSYLPLIFNNVIYNYIANILINIVLLIFVGVIIPDKKTAPTKK